jgi:hypothetical protein
MAVECSKKILLLNGTTVESALNKLDSGLQKYLWIQEEFSKINVAEDLDFQKRFNHFYRVRRDGAWRKSYFDLLESSRFTSPTFEFILNSMLNMTGRLEASFSSKLIATLNPNMPVLDSVVLKNLGLKLPVSPKNKFQSVVNVYSQLENQLNELLTSSSGQKAISMFRLKFPNAQVTDIKILDLILWQSR